MQFCEQYVFFLQYYSGKSGTLLLTGAPVFTWTHIYTDTHTIIMCDSFVSLLSHNIPLFFLNKKPKQYCACFVVPSTLYNCSYHINTRTKLHKHQTQTTRPHQTETTYTLV